MYDGQTGVRTESCWNDCLKEEELSDRAPHRTLRPVKLLEMIVWHGGPIKPRIPLRVAYEVRAARQQTVRSPRTMYPHSQEWHQNREETVYLPA
jgi:hypothetical protein